MNVLCLAGAWCGDCINQCPIFQRIAEATDQIALRFLDRDEHADVQAELSLCGGNRVPVLVFLSEDFTECGRYGDRTLAKYRDMAATLLGPACPTGIGAPDPNSLAAVTSDWLNEFERVQLMLRLSARLRERHGD
jgi:thiol-disulfide isomerase/thioredoxin